MSIESIRLECYREAAVAKSTKPGVELPIPEIAEEFAKFCAGDAPDLRLTALKMAIAQAGRRAKVVDIIVGATAFLNFARKRPEPVQAPKPSPAPQKQGRRRSHSR